ncbi:TrgA family protein [Planktotalea sp.]|uniref:TrgA family protein n=1 Tax=Planktotalea sp. TaxID=2029877 RepID=UPI00341385E0
MPIAARFIAARCLAVLAWVLSEHIKPLFDENKAFGNFNFISLTIAVVIGWQVIDSRAGGTLVRQSIMG